MTDPISPLDTYPDRSGHRHRAAGDGGAEGREKHGAHGHPMSAEADSRYLIVALALIVGFMIAEVIAALASGSLALLADAGHMLADAGALGVSLWAARLAGRPPVGAWTYGFKRVEILSAAGNGITLLVVSALVAFESVLRLIHPPHVEGGTVVVVALVGVALNLTAAWVLAQANRSSLNVEGAFQHILTDMYGFIATAIAGVVILISGFGRADAIASLVVVGLMLKACWGLLGASGWILLEAAPEGVDLDEVRSHLVEVPHVSDVHDLHVWTVTSDLPALSAHVVIEDSCFLDGHAPQILDQIHACLVGHFDVEHCTFQLEPVGHIDHEPGCHR